MPKALICPCCGGTLNKKENVCQWCGSEIDYQNEDNTLKVVIQHPEIDENTKVGDTYLLQKRNNYNTESNSDFDSKYHYKFKNKKKSKFLFAVIIIAIVVIVSIIIIANH